MDTHVLLNSSEGDEANDDIKDFYVRNLPSLMQYPMASVPSHILRNIAVLLHHTSLFHSDWQEYATKMGVTDNLLLARIQASARSYNDQELYITLKSALPHKMLGHIITTLLDSQRYDVLKVIQRDIIKLLESNSTTEVKEVESIHNLSSNCTINKLTNTTNSAREFTNATKETNSGTFSSLNSSSYSNTNNLDTYESYPELLDKQELNDLQQSSTMKDFATAIQNISISDNNPPCEEIPIQVISSVPAEERLTVFVQHTELDYHIAKELAGKLKDEGIVVTTLSEMDNLIPMDHAGGALSKMFQKVDFIVPIVSEELLKQIHPMAYENYLESSDAINNRLLYKLIMNEYSNNRCVNFRVRPVIVPNLNRRLLIHDIIFSFSFRLWGEVPKLIRILKETKTLMPPYSMINSMRNT